MDTWNTEFTELDPYRGIGTVWPGKSDLYHALQCTFIPRLNPAVSVAPALKQATETR